MQQSYANTQLQAARGTQARGHGGHQLGHGKAHKGTGSNQESTQAIPIREPTMCNWDHHTTIPRGGCSPFPMEGDEILDPLSVHRPVSYTTEQDPHTWSALFPSTLRSSKWGLLGARRTAATPDTHPKVCRLKQTSTLPRSCVSAGHDPSHVSSTTGSEQSLLSQAFDTVPQRKGNSWGHLGTLIQPTRLLALQTWGFTWGYYTLEFLNAIALPLKNHHHIDRYINKKTLIPKLINTSVPVWEHALQRRWLSHECWCHGNSASFPSVS